MNYEQAVEYIHSTIKFGTVLGLETISELLNLMGNPQDNLKFIHVAGTNGKGSTSSYIMSALSDAGFRVGLYISPFVERFTERIQINGEEITEDGLAEIIGFVKECADRLVAVGKVRPTEFELITAAAFMYYNNMNCDFVVLETGLGGRLDATNIIKSPLVSVITMIGYDHTDYLGHTLREITYEKCGIIKENCFVVSYPVQEAGVLSVLHDACERNNAALIVTDEHNIQVLSSNLSGNEFIYNDLKVSLKMLGVHQIYNAVTAIEVLDVLRDRYLVPISDFNISEGLYKVRFAGRLEVLSKNPLVIIDGAHNYSGIEALYNFLLDFAGGRKIIMVMGMLCDKEYEKCVVKIAPLCDTFIATLPDNPRACPPEILSSIAKKFVDISESILEPEAAFEKALSRVGEDKMICVCGSLYLLGKIKKYYNNK